MSVDRMVVDDASTTDESRQARDLVARRDESSSKPFILL
jgi:hypothetical protein